MGQLYILDLTKRGVDIDKAARGKGRDRISAHTVRTWNALPGQDHPKDAKGRWTSGHPSVGLMGDLPDVVGRLSDDDLKRADAHANSLIAALTAEKGRRGVAAMAAAQKAKPLKATKPKAAAKAIDPALTAKIAEIRKRPLPGDREFLEGALGKLTIAQIESLDENPFPAGSKASKVEEMVRRLTRQLASEAVTHQGSAKGRDYDANYRRRLADAVERGDRDEYASLVAGFGTGGTGPGLPAEKTERPAQSATEAQINDLTRRISELDAKARHPETGKMERDRHRAKIERLKAERAALTAGVMGKPAPAAKPLKATKSESRIMQHTVDIDKLKQRIDSAKTAEEAREHLRGLRVPELKALAGTLGMAQRSMPNKKAWEDGIINFSVQNRLNSEAIRDQTNFTPKVKDRQATARAAEQKLINETRDPAARALRKAGDDIIREEMQRIAAGPRYLDTPRTVQGNGAFGPGSFHPDGRMGTAWQSLSPRQASEDIGGMRLDDALAEAIRMGYDGQPGRIGEQMTRFREIISQVKDPKVKADLEYAFGRLRPQAPHGLSAKELADAPEPLRRLLTHLETIPDTGQGGREVSHLADILRRWSAGEMRAGMLDIEVDRLAGYRHESQEGHHEVSRAARKAADEIRAMRRDLKRPGS